MVLAAFITTCFVIGGVSAWYLRRGVHVEAGRRMLLHAVAFAAIAVPLQIFVGDLHGLNVREHQPVKLAAMEGHWHDDAPGAGTPLVLFAWPNEQAERNDYEVAVPRLGSVILTHSLGRRDPAADRGAAQRAAAGETGVLRVPGDGRARHGDAAAGAGVVVGVAARHVVHVALAAARLDVDAAVGLRRIARRLVRQRDRSPALRGLRPAAHRRCGHADARGGSVLTSLVVFVFVYVTVFGAGIWYLLKMFRKGPLREETPPEREHGEKTPARPLSAGDDVVAADGAAQERVP